MTIIIFKLLYIERTLPVYKVLYLFLLHERAHITHNWSLRSEVNIVQCMRFFVFNRKILSQYFACV